MSRTRPRKADDPDARRRTGGRRALAAISTAVLVAACGGAASTGPTGTPVSATGTPTATATPAPADARWGMTPEQATAWEQVEAAANQEGKVVYYSLGSVPEDRVDELKTAFNKDYPNIKLEYLNVGNGSAMTARIQAEEDAHVYLADVADHSVRGARLLEQYLVPFVPPAVADPSVSWLYDPIADENHTGTVNATFAQFFTIWINTDLVSPADEPKNLMDVATNPKFKGQIIMRQPWSSGGGSHTFRFAKQVYGMPWITDMQGQDLTFATDQDAALLQVARGEFAVGVGLTGRQAASLIDQGLPLKSIWPDDFVVTVTEGTQILQNGPHPNAAKVFVNWMMTKAGQQLWADLGQFPLRKDVPPQYPWMQGVANETTIYENLYGADQLQALYDEAAGYFKP